MKDTLKSRMSDETCLCHVRKNNPKEIHDAMNNKGKIANFNKSANQKDGLTNKNRR